MKLYRLFDKDQDKIIKTKLTFRPWRQYKFFNIGSEVFCVIGKLTDKILIVQKMDYNEIQETMNRILESEPDKED